jgi:hypothetical protein
MSKGPAHRGSCAKSDASSFLLHARRFSGCGRKISFRSALIRPIRQIRVKEKPCHEVSAWIIQGVTTNNEPRSTNACSHLIRVLSRCSRAKNPPRQNPCKGVARRSVGGWQLAVGSWQLSSNNRNRKSSGHTVRTIRHPGFSCVGGEYGVESAHDMRRLFD